MLTLAERSPKFCLLKPFMKLKRVVGVVLQWALPVTVMSFKTDLLVQYRE